MMASAFPPHDSNERREQLTKEVLIRFLHHGIKQVKIGDLTVELGISSKTLYQIFEDKEGLVRACFKMYLANTTEDFRKHHLASDNVAELMVNFYHSALSGLRRVNPAFFSDLSHLFPMIWNAEDAFGLSHSRYLIARGSLEGIFVAKLDQHLCAHALTLLLRSVFEREPFTSRSPEDQFNFVIWPYVRGLCTEEGRVAFRQYRHDKPNHSEE